MSSKPASLFLLSSVVGLVIGGFCVIVLKEATQNPPKTYASQSVDTVITLLFVILLGVVMSVIGVYFYA